MKNRPAPRCALITGASQGLGRAFAEECAARGMGLFLVALPQSGLPEVARFIAGKWGVRVDWLETDLTRDGALDQVLAALERCGFETDLLVNNAGIGPVGFFGDSPLSEHESVIRLNVLALVHLTHRLIPALKRRKAAYILNVASLGAFFPMVSLPVYSATKSFVLTFSLALREELGESVGVGTLCPGTFRNDRVTNEYVNRLPWVCRWGCLYPSEVARAGLDGLLRGKAVIVPGLMSKLVWAIGPLVPRPLVAGAVRRLWGGFGEAARSAAVGNPGPGRSRVAVVYHSAAGGTRVVAELLAELLSADHDAKAVDIHAAGATKAAGAADFVVFCYPTYFLRPSTSMKEFISRLEPAGPRRPAYLVTTYELYAENSLRACARLVREKGMTVLGSASVRAPGTDLTCVFPDWLCPWLYRFERGLRDKLCAIADEVRVLVRLGGRERVPWPKWYTPFAQVLQRGLLDGFFEWRKRIHIIPDRCSECGACVAGCDRGAWVRDDGRFRHDPERCELCTRCIHRCPKNAIVLSRGARDNRRLDAGLYSQLKAEARSGLQVRPCREEERR